MPILYADIILGSNPIILYLDSGTPYTEQGARAADYLGNDISDQVTIDSGNFDRNVAGDYTITCTVLGPMGMTVGTPENPALPSAHSLADPSLLDI